VGFQRWDVTAGVYDEESNVYRIGAEIIDSKGI